MPSFRSLARNHDFTVLWIGQTASELGSRVSMFTFPLLGYALTHSTVVAALAETAYLLGLLATLLPGGVLADRLDRRRLMRTAEAGGAVLYGSLVVAGLAGHLTVSHLIVAALGTGAGSGLIGPASQSAIRSIVPDEELPTALSQVQARKHVADLLGAPLGGLLYAVGRWVPFVADLASYVVNWLLLGRLRADLSAQPGEAEPGEAEPQRALADLKAGWRFIYGDRFFRVLGIWAPLANLTLNAVFFTATLRLIAAGFPAWQIGLVDLTAGAFGLLGAVCAPWIIERMPTGLLLIAVAWSFVPLLVPMALWTDPLVVGAALSAGLFLNPAGNAGISSYQQRLVPIHMMGRFGATMQFTCMSTMPLAPVVAGALLAFVGGTTAVLGLAGLVALVALVPTLSATVRAVPRPAQWSRATAEGRAVDAPPVAAC